MKKITLLLFFVFVCLQMYAQQVSNYTFSQTSASYTEITGGTVLATATGSTGALSFDSQLWAIADGSIPFNFNFNGTNYTGCSVNSNGYITFGTTTSSAFTSTAISSTTGYNGAIAAWSGDLNAAFISGVIAGETRWEVVGTAPNREFVIQFKDWRPAYSTSTTNVPFINFQIRLVETSNEVKVVYGSNGYAAGSTAASGTRQIGLRGATNADFNNRLSATTTLFNSSTAGTANNSTQAFNSSVATPGMPVLGTTYAWSPPAACTGTPVAGTATPSSQTLLTGQTPATLTVTGQTTGVSELTYQWQESADGSTGWVNAVGGTGATTLSYTPPAYSGTTIYYRLVITCTASGSSANSTAASLSSCSTVTSFIQNFDTVSTPGLPSCWAKVGTLGTVNTQTTSPNSSPNTLYMYGTSGTAQATLAMQPVSNLGTGTHRLRFNMRANFTVGGVVEFGYLTNPSDATTFVSLGSATAAALTYSEYIITPAAGSYSNFPAIRHTGVPANSLLIDDVRWEPIPSCIAPTAIATSTITSTTVNLSWSSSDTAFEYVVQTAGTGVPTGSGTAITGTSVTAMGLTPSTAYEVYVRTNCTAGGNGFSSWSGPVNFTTACASFTPTYTQDFTTFPAPCWIRAGAGTPATGPTGTATGIWAEDGFLNVTGTGAIKANLYSNNRIGWYISPTVNMTAGGYRVKYDVGATVWNGTATATMGSDDKVIFLMSIDGGTTWTTMETFDTSNTPTNTTTSKIYNIPAITSATTLFAFYASDGATDDTEDYDFFIDNFVVETVPSCIAPSALTVSGITSTSANLSWTSSGSAFEYVVQAQGTGMPTGAGVANASTSVTASGLTANTAYEVWVRTNCTGTGNGFSSWTGPVNFYTGYCIPSSTGSATYVNNFTTTNGSTNISNLATGFTTGGYLDATSQTVTSYASNSFNFNAEIVGGTAGFSIWVDWNNDLVFDNATEKVYNTTSYGNGPFTGTITIPGATAVGNYRMRIVTDWNASNPSDPCAAATRAEFEDYTIAIVTAPACTNPFGLTANTVTDVSANLAWTASTGNYEYVLNTTGVAPTSAGTAIATNAYNATGLTQSTQYYFYVRTVCAGPTYSTWSMVTFTTIATPPANDACTNAFNAATLPYTNSQDASSASNNGGFLAACSFGMNDGVWYTVTGNGADITVAVTNVVGWDPEIGVYTGSCGTFTCVGSTDSGGTSGSETYVITGSTVGVTYYINIGHYSGTTDNPEGPFQIDISTNLSTNLFEDKAFSAYPNPIKDVLNISYNREISNVSVMNLLGQVVLTKKINATQSTIDMSQLNSGAYLVTLEVDGVIKSIKVIKE